MSGLDEKSIWNENIILQHAYRIHLISKKSISYKDAQSLVRGLVQEYDLANGVNKTTEQALPIHGVRLSLPHYELYKKLDDKRMKTHVDSEGVWHLYLKHTAEALLDDCDIYEKGFI